MHTFVKFIKEFKVPKKEEIKIAIKSFNKKRITLFVLLIVIALVSMLNILNRINNHFMIEVPASGGSVVEGVIGIPTLVNPVIALSDADKDMVALVYSGLMRKDIDGSFIPDLAESTPEISKDKMTYTFVLKKNIFFHDKKPLTANDVVFTINKIKDPLIKSPEKMNWEGISVLAKDNRTIVFSLKQPLISFMDNTTIGILPMHIWQNVTEQEFGLSSLNTKPIGSGPYKVDEVIKNKDGNPEKYNLSRFSHFALGIPHIKEFSIISFANENDLINSLKDKTVDQAGGLSPKNIAILEKENYNINTATLPQIFGMFLNIKNSKVLSEKPVINAINKIINKDEVINSVLYGYGKSINSPIPETMGILNEKSISNTEEAVNILDKSGWLIGDDGFRYKGGIQTITETKKVGKKTITQKKTINTGVKTKLEFSISTGNTEELKQTANIIKEQLGKLGIYVDIKIYESGQLNQIIRERSYEALLFGQVMNHESGLYSFWHSSQINDPGLNIAMYNNKIADNIIENAQKLDKEGRVQKYNEFNKQFISDLPAIMLYSPKYIYATSHIQNINLNKLINTSDRLLSVYKWYAEEDRIWKIFKNNK